MKIEEIMAQLKSLPAEQRASVLKELGESSVEVALSTAKTELDRQRELTSQLQEQIKELNKAAKESKPRLTVAELEAQMDQKLVEVVTLARQEADNEIKKLRNELDKERVLGSSVYQEMPARYRSQVSGETVEELQQSAEAIFNEYKETEAEMRKRFLAQLGIDPEVDIEQVKDKIVIKQEESEQEQPEQAQETLETLAERYKGTDAGRILEQAKKLQQTGKASGTQQPANIQVETPATASSQQNDVLKRFMNPHGVI